MEGGTTFVFVTDGIESALEQAKAAAQRCDVKIGGGVETVRQYLCAGLIDELHFAMSPVVLGQREAMFAGSTCRRSATASPNIKPPKTPPTSFSAASASSMKIATYNINGVNVSPA